MEYKLGKKPPRIDKRTIQLKNILKILPPIPEVYSFDERKGVTVPTPMYLNDKLGDCVIAGTAHQSLRFEFNEQGRIIGITDDDVRNQYFHETGGPDSGLVMLDHMKEWKKKGFNIGGRKLLCLRWGGTTYQIDAFAQVTPDDVAEVKAAIFLLTGVNAGFSLPDNYQDAIRKEEPWRDTSMPANPYNGHCMYIVDFPSYGFARCVTWGQYQLMTWEWLAKYCDEAYAIVDAIDSWIGNSALDIEKLRGYLKEVSK